MNIAIPKDRALKDLSDVTKILSAHGVPFWLSDGTLLGAIREKNFISHDYDIDIGIDASKLDKNILDEFISKGFRVCQIYGSIEDSLNFSIARNELRTDLFGYYKDGDKMRYSYFDINGPDSAKRYDCWFPMFSPIKYDFLGLPVFIPSEPEVHLETQYGPDWRTPNPVWNWATDPYNKKYIGTVQGIKANTYKVIQTIITKL